MRASPPVESAPTPKPSAEKQNGQVAISRLSPAALWRATALICATFTLIVAISMTIGYKRSIAEDPLGARELTSLREKLHTAPTDETLKKRIRAVDLRERQRYFARVRRNSSGAWLLVLGSGLFVFSANKFYAARRKATLPRAMATLAEIERDASRARAALIGTTAIIVVSMTMIGMLEPVSIQRQTTSTAAARSTSPAVAPAAALTPEILRTQWPRFRGADGLGVSAFTNIPVTWNIETGENIAWKTAVPLPGHNSPVIWGNKLFLTGSSETAREIFCFDVSNGELLWRLPVTLITTQAVAELEIPKLSGAASATVACDDKRVFAIFATGELVAADHAGHAAWSRNFGKLENPYGHATSLVIWRDRLVVQLDQGSEESPKSRLYAFDPATGKVIWEQKRLLPSTWATPIVINAANTDQIVCLGEPWLISYSFNDGKELWRYKGFGSDLTPSPIFAGGLVVAISPNQKLVAIRPDGNGDVTATHTAWQTEQNVPDISSPTSNGKLLFTLETAGNLLCLDTASGKKIWEHTYDGEFQSSPAIAGDHLYVSTTEGDTYVVQAADQFKELAHNKLNDPIRASPAFTDGYLFVRGVTNLYCLGPKHER